MHRRDLAIGFGILFLLVITVSMLIVTSQRARRLGRLQMEFVTAVSHELRSPLTIIRSAAENLGEGVVETRDQVKRYASAIERQTRRLSRLVEEILLFASTNKGRHHYDAVELEVGDIIDAALTALNDLVEASHFTIEREVPPDLPKVVGDRFALSQCLQNLIINALKYGGAERWIGIKASIDDSPLASKEIRIDVSDYGLGISAADLPHVFEAFYRSPMVTATQIHGTGLGLSLAQSIAESMGGRLTVTSSLNQGSTFTLCLPCATPPLEGLEPRMTRITRMGRDISTPSA
jgi:signal transduction histidine kinase